MRHPRYCLAHHPGISSNIASATDFSAPNALAHCPAYPRWRTAHVAHADASPTLACHPCHHASTPPTKARHLPIIDKIFERNCSFHVKQCTTGKVRFLFFTTFFANTNKIFVSGGGLCTRQ